MYRVGLLAYSLHGGGAERMVSRLADAFVRKGIQTTVILFIDEGVAYKINPGVKIIRCADNSKNKVKRTLCAIRRIRRTIRQERLDVLLAFTVSLPPFAILAATGLPCKVIGAERTNPRALKIIYKALVSFASPFCDGYIFQTKGAMNCYPVVTQRKGIVIGNIAPLVFDVGRKRKENAICSVGRLHRDKDFKTLLYAVAKVRETNHEATLTIFGDGEQKNELITLAESLNIADAVFFEGFAQNVLERIPEYTVFAFSSRAEGLPNALLEAMSVGLPCVATNCDFGPAELIENGHNGFLVPVGDSEHMAQRLLELLSDAALRERIGKEATKVQDMYSEEKVVNMYLNYIEQVMMANHEQE